MTLYKKLSQATNSVDGNYMASNYKYDGVLHEDRYHCIGCSSFVKENDWDEGIKLCKECAEEYEENAE